MRIGGSMFLIAIGAILKWAVTDHVKNVNLSTIGVILMVVGVVGLVLSVAYSATRRRTDVIHESAPIHESAQGYAAGQPVGGVSPTNSRTTYIEPGPRA
jgi:hypothetical protein